MVRSELKLCISPMYKKDKIKPYRYSARVYHDKDMKYIGCFRTKEEALDAYNKMTDFEVKQRLTMKIRDMRGW
jgi:hypothetical protein